MLIDYLFIEARFCKYLFPLVFFFLWWIVYLGKYFTKIMYYLMMIRTINMLSLTYMVKNNISASVAPENPK